MEDKKQLLDMVWASAFALELSKNRGRDRADRAAGAAADARKQATRILSRENQYGLDAVHTGGPVKCLCPECKTNG